MSIYKECDIRGIFGTELTEKTAYNIGRAVGTIIDGKNVLVCGDVRVSTPILKDCLIEGLLESGASVIDMGLSPTPVFYFGKKLTSAYAGVMVTASHNPAVYNGFKIMFGDLPIVPTDIKKIEQIIEQGCFKKDQGCISFITTIENEYRKKIASLIFESSLSSYSLVSFGRTFKIVLDCCDGTVSKLAPRMFRDAGYDVVELFTGWDGTFPNRDPNPAVYDNLNELRKIVLSENADLGAAFDGDGDRVVFVDDKGNVVMSEQALVLMLRKCLRNEKSSIVYDLKSSSIVVKEIEKLGGKAIAERSGYAFIKRTFIDNNSILAGEISGHYFFRDLGQDDGIYAALFLARIVYESKEKLSDLIRTIDKTIITPDVRIPWPYVKQDALMKKMEKLRELYSISQIDGIRLDFGYGWALIRKSVTEQAITLRIEAGNIGEIKKIVQILIGVEPDLKMPLLKEIGV
jgi:phosphomannomutase/phosphoglucomutase